MDEPGQRVTLLCCVIPTSPPLDIKTYSVIAAMMDHYNRTDKVCGMDCVSVHLLLSPVLLEWTKTFSLLFDGSSSVFFYLLLDCYLLCMFNLRFWRVRTKPTHRWYGIALLDTV